MIAYYDLSVAPPTYDVVGWLMWVEAERRRRNAKTVDIKIIPGPAGGFRNDNLWPRSLETRKYLRDNVLVPICKMLPHATVTVEDERPAKPEPDSIGFLDLHHGHGFVLDGLRQGIRPLKAPKDVELDPTLVTITLRECEHWPERNSDVEEWLIAALGIEDMGFDVIFIRDTINAGEVFTEFPTFPQASVYMNVRADVYASSFCNMFVDNGPAWLAVSLNAPAMIFRPCHEGSAAWFSSQKYTRNGVNVGDQLPTSPRWQRLVWQHDKAVHIVNAFREFMSEAAA